MTEPFSARLGYSRVSKEISIREDAPENFRYFLLDQAVQLGVGPKTLRGIICSILRARPNPDNWSEYPNIWMEVEELVYGCQWFHIYDFIEDLSAEIKHRDQNASFVGDGPIYPSFEQRVNSYMDEEGIGWQLKDGEIITRGPEAFEQVVKEAQTTLINAGRPTAAHHIHESLQAISRRPSPDISGAVYHSVGALECIARDMVGDSKATLGEILKRYPDLLPAPLDSALSQIWGYASNEARHVKEGQDIDYSKAELIVGLAASMAIFLNKKS